MDDRNFYNEQIYSNLWNNYGVALANLGRTKEARNAYANAVRVDPGNEVARDNLDNLGYPSVVKGVVDIVKNFLKWKKEYLKGLYRK